MSATTSGSADPASSSGDDPTLRAPTVPGADVVGAEAAKGTCHNCGGSMARGNVELAKMCGACGTRFHASDCGGRLAGAGLHHAVGQCPKVRAEDERAGAFPAGRAPRRDGERGVALPPTIFPPVAHRTTRGSVGFCDAPRVERDVSIPRARDGAPGRFSRASIAPGPALARPTSRAVPGTSARERVAPSPGPVTPPREEKYPQTHGSGFDPPAESPHGSARALHGRSRIFPRTAAPSLRGLVRRPDET